MERANIIPHYTARNLLNSPGILGLRRPNNGTAGERRLGRAGWPRLLTWNQRPALTSTRPVFHPALPAAPRDHTKPWCIEVVGDSLQRLLWVTRRIWVIKEHRESPGWQKPDRQLHSQAGEDVIFSVSLSRESQTFFFLSVRLIWNVITCGWEGADSFKKQITEIWKGDSQHFVRL